MASKKWFLYVVDHHEGPFSLEEMNQKFTSGSVHMKSYVWAEGMDGWKPVSDVRELVEGLAPKENQNELSQFIQQEKAKVHEPTQTIATNELKFVKSVAEKVQKSEDELRKGNPVKKAFYLFSFLLLFVLGGLFAGIELGYLNKNDLYRTISPTLKKMVEIAPFLKPFISPIPPLDDVEDQDYLRLKQAAWAKAEGNPSLALAVSNQNLQNPVFYVATNLPEGASLDLYLISIPGAVLYEKPIELSMKLQVKDQLAISTPIQTAEFPSLPRGKYQVILVDSLSQNPEVSSVLQKLPDQKMPLPKVIQVNRKLALKEVVFLGGKEDDSYKLRLKDYQQKQKQKEEEELVELRVVGDALEGQFNISRQEWRKLSNLKVGPKKQKEMWEKFSQEWMPVLTQIRSGLLGGKLSMNPELAKQVRDFGKEIEDFHLKQGEYFDFSTDKVKLMTTLGSEAKRLETNYKELQTRLVSQSSPQDTPKEESKN